MPWFTCTGRKATGAIRSWSPALFLNNARIGSLPSNAYRVLEFDIASYQLEMRRPLFGTHWTFFADGPLDFTLISSFTLDAEAGGI